ncbi:MAG: T9SS type A sorting domain-containing protein [Flavobacteriaceae bacterium]
MMKQQLLFTAVLLMGHIFLGAQTVTTFTDGTPDDAIAMDANGNIYCSNYMGDTVFKFTPSWEGTPFVTGLITPNGLAFNSLQELYVCDGQGNTIYKYDLAGNQLASYAISGHPSGITKSFDDDSMIFTLYTGNKIMHLATDGTITEISAAPELSGPVGIVYDHLGALYVGNYNNREIYKVLANGNLEYIAKLPTDGGNLPNLGFITYGQGKLWGTIMGNDKIYSINPNAVDDYTLFAGSTQGSNDGDISVATFHTPNGIYFDEPNDRIYVTDFGTKNLRVISGVSLGNDDFNLDKKGFVLFPNPAESHFSISYEEDSTSTISLKMYDASGKLIFSKENHSSAESIPVSPLEKGIYTLQIEKGNEVFFKKLIKQ